MDFIFIFSLSLSGTVRPLPHQQEVDPGAQGHRQRPGRGGGGVGHGLVFPGGALLVVSWTRVSLLLPDEL